MRSYARIAVATSLAAFACVAQSARHIPFQMAVGVPFPVENSLFPDTLYPILLTTANRTRPVPGAFVNAPTALCRFDDSLLLTFAFDSSGADIGILRYRSSSSELDTLPTPPNFSPNLTTLAFSPDARYMAYVAFPGDGTGHGVVRRFPGGTPVLQTPGVTVPETDAQVGYAEWIDSLAFALWIRADSLPPNHWLRFRGQVTHSDFVTDTIDVTTPEPQPSS